MGDKITVHPQTDQLASCYRLRRLPCASMLKSRSAFSPKIFRRPSLERGTWWTFIPSGVGIALVAFALALINYAVDEITNPRLAGRTKRKDRRR